MAVVVLHLHGASFARRYQIASQAIVAAAAGDEVRVVLWFDALARWVRGTFDEPLPGEDGEVARRHAALSLPPPSRMLAEARTLGARLWACETGVRLAGLDPTAAREAVDEVPGLQEIVAAQREAAFVLYV
jgi:peroxiredoxin family protein